MRPAAVFAAAFFILSLGVWREGLATAYVDPVGKIAAQDEAVYSHIALRMAERNEWLTPVFLGRYALFKPPLLYWASAAGVKLFGRNEFALRLPSLIAGALVAALLFAWMPDARAGLLAALLLVSDPLWRGLSRVALTDGLLALWVTLAMRAIDRGSPAGFAVATAAALMTKGIAGLIPVFILAAWWVVDSRREPWKWLAACAAAVVIASPWFLYQWQVHPRWFWAEFVEVEILGFTAGSAVPQTSEENHVWFYARRLLRMDWLLVAFAFLGSFRTWKHGRKLLIIWAVVGMALVLANQYRNVAYLAPLLPAMAWMGAENARRSKAAMAMAALVLVVRAASPTPSAPIAPAPLLKQYAAMQRGRELIIIDPDDQFVATTYPIARVRYCFFGNEADYGRYALNFRHLGIALTVDEFLNLDEPLYRARLREWNLDSAEPIGTVIVARDAADAARLREARPEADFLVKENGSPKLLLAGR